MYIVTCAFFHSMGTKVIHRLMYLWGPGTEHGVLWSCDGNSSARRIGVACAAMWMLAHVVHQGQTRGPPSVLSVMRRVQMSEATRSEGASARA